MTADCDALPTGFTPITDGVGLYPGGNDIPAAHLAQGMLRARAIEPLDAAGDPDKAGKIVFLSWGISNCNQAFDTLQNLTTSNRRSTVQLVNGAIGGTSTSQMDATYVSDVDDLIVAAGATRFQVQVLLVYSAEADESADLETRLPINKANLKSALELAVAEYPNLQQIVFTSRECAQFADLANSPHPEPQAYNNGFIYLDTIAAQVLGTDPDFAYAVWPWMGWLAYTWADGPNGRAYDDLVWVCENYQPADGTHLVESGNHKIRDLWEYNLTTNPVLSRWYLGSMPVTPLGSTADNTNATSYETDEAFLPVANEPVIAFVCSRIAGSSPAAPTLSGNNITWQQVQTETFQTLSTERSRITMFAGISSSPTETALTADFGAVTQNACHISVFQVSNAKTADFVVQAVPNALDTTGNLPITLASPAGADNLAIAAVATVATTSITFGDGWEPIHGLSSSGEAMRLTTACAHVFDTSVVATLASGAQHMGGIAAEIAEAPEPEPPAASENRVRRVGAAVPGLRMFPGRLKGVGV